MEDNKLQSQGRIPVDDENRESSSIMENEQKDILGDLFTFRNVLLFAVVLGIIILLFSLFS